MHATPVALFAALLAAAQAPPAGPPKGVRVFTAGHSFHLPMVAPFEQIVKAAGVADHATAGRQMLGGSTVTQHWDLPDERDQARKALRAGRVDVLTLSPHILMPDPAIDKFTGLLLEHNPNGRVTIQASWLPNEARISLALGYRDDDKNKTNPDDLRKAGRPWLDKFRAQIKAINERHAATAKRPVAFLVPVGEAVVRLRERVAKGEVPGIAKQSELFSDGFGHGRSPIGVLTAYCHYAVIYGRNPTGLPVPDALKAAKLGDNEAKANRVLQEVAWEAVTGEPLSGVKAK